MTATLLVLAALTSGLVAGLFAAFAYSVMPGLRRVDDRAFVQTMRGINRAILNPVFGVLFGGALVLSVGAALAAWDEPGVRWWALAGAVLYAATLAVTGARNVPLNESLDRGEGPDAILRAAFEVPWTRWNLLRTATNVASATCLLVALLRL